MSRRTRGWMVLALCLLVGASPMAQAASPVVAVRLVMTDVQGTPVMKKDLQGHILARYDYRPYGARQGGPAEAGPGYTGHVNDPQTGLVYMQQRYYDPAVGRFLSVDPVGAALGDVYNFNRYGYANNDPIGNIDPDGRFPAQAAKQLGRALRAAWISKGDEKKFDAIMAGYKAQDRQDLNVALGLTEIGIVKDAVEITVKTANGGDATAQGTGAIAGEIAGQVAEKALARKIGDPAAKAVAAIAGQIVGDVVKTATEQSQKKNSSARPEDDPTKAPRSRPLPPPPITDFGG